MQHQNFVQSYVRHRYGFPTLHHIATQSEFPDHAAARGSNELISVLTELYTLLDSLAAIPFLDDHRESQPERMGVGEVVYMVDNSMNQVLPYVLQKTSFEHVYTFGDQVSKALG